MRVHRAWNVPGLVGSFTCARILQIEPAVDDGERRISKVGCQDECFDEGRVAHQWLMLPRDRDEGRGAPAVRREGTCTSMIRVLRTLDRAGRCEGSRGPGAGRR